MRAVAVGLIVLLAAARARSGEGRFFAIRVADADTRRGVPLVELRTVHNVRYLTDSNGLVAFHEPGLMGHRVFFHLSSHGYEFPKDGFGNRGRALAVTAGGRAELKLKRLNIAERLYRVTGAGIYRDSVLLGRAVPLKEPVLNGQVLGSDSVMNAVFQGKVYWFWGDTNRPGYPLGNFHVPGATSLLPKDGGLDPEAGVDLSYFVDAKGFAKETCRMPGEGPTWIDGLVVLRDGAERERMFAAYAKVRGFLEVYQRGIVEFHDAEKRFEKVLEFDKDAPLRPFGHPFTHTEGGVEHVYFGDPCPLVRVRATVEDLTRLDRYEAFTCLKPGTGVADGQLDRAEDGTLRYAWRKATQAVGPGEQAQLIKAGKLKPEEALLQLQDAETGKAVVAHRGSVCWNARRRRWVMIVAQVGGTSYLGETWYAEADTPLGPWVYARKVVTHNKYSFYNPTQHPMFDKEGGRIIFFEGTYTALFSGSPDKTPWYDYNQILYKLNLADPRLALPVAVYRWTDERGVVRLGTVHREGAAPRRGEVAFFALDRAVAGSVPVYERDLRPGVTTLQVGTGRDAKERQPLFHGLPVKEQRPAAAVPLYEFVHEASGRRAYSTDASWSQPGYRRSDAPLCLVWRNPMAASLALPR